MSSAVASPMRSSSKKLTSSTLYVPRIWWGRSDFLDAARLAPGQLDAEFLRRAEHLVVGLAHLQGHAVARQHLDVEAERLQLLEQHLERLRDARLGDVLALDDGLVDLHAA